MKRLGLIILLAAGLLACGFVLARYSQRDAPSNHGLSELSARTKQVVIPILDLRNASIEESVAFLNIHAARAGLSKDLYVVWKEGDPVPGGLRAVSAVEAKESARVVPVIPGLDPLPPTPPSSSPLPKSSPQITVNFADLPLRYAAKYVSGLGDCRVHESEGRFFIYPQDKLAPVLIRRELFLLNRESADFYLLHHLGIATSGSTTDVRPMLEAQGVYFSPGAYARYIPNDLKVELCLASDDMEIAEIIFSGGCTGIPAVSSRWERIKHKATPYWYEATSYLPWSSHP